MSSPDAQRIEKVLVLVVDRDDDLGQKTKISSPVIGREKNLNAASLLALADPEEPDANAIFAALSAYDELHTKFGVENVEIATVTGTPDENIDSDRKIADGIRAVLNEFRAQKCVFVSDGYSDQEVIPLISSRVPIMSVRRVVIRHSESVEETWALLSRYLRKAAFDPRYARMLLGYPSILLLAVGLLMLLRPDIVLPAFLFIAGLIMFVRGFEIDKTISTTVSRIRHYATSTSANQIRFFSTLVSISLITVSVYVGGRSAIGKIMEANPGAKPLLEDPAYWLFQAPTFTGMFINGSIDILVLGVLAVVLGNGLFFYIVRHGRFWRMLQALVVTVWVWAFFRRIGYILEFGTAPSILDPSVVGLIIIVVLGLITISLTFILTRLLRRKYADFFTIVK